ncbi:MAG: hypothetical protein E7371_05935 [Clostridiales bacterium]|nr:hypothetical protein [Clostridiales bacterium]
MKKHLFLWQFAGFTLAVALGSLLHFLFEWTGAFALAPISAVNESTWEHMKILFFPMLFFACAQYWFFRAEFYGFWWIKCIGSIVGILAIPTLFYTYNGAFGKTPDWLNITFFFLSAGIGFGVEYWLFRKELSFPYPCIAFIGMLIIALLFVVFTFYPPYAPLFQDPVTGLYGIIK